MLKDITERYYREISDWTRIAQEIEVMSTSRSKKFLNYFFSSTIVLSSTNLKYDSCLYATNTTRTIIKKSMILDIKCPYLNSVISPHKLVTLAVKLSKLPAGKNIPIRGSIKSFTKKLLVPKLPDQ